MEDARDRMSTLTGIGQPAFCVSVERHAELLHKHLLNERRALLGQHPRCLGEAEASTGAEDVLGEEVRGILVAACHDTALGVAGVAFLRFVGARGPPLHPRSRSR